MRLRQPPPRLRLLWRRAPPLPRLLLQMRPTLSLVTRHQRSRILRLSQPPLLALMSSAMRLLLRPPPQLRLRPLRMSSRSEGCLFLLALPT